MIAIVPFADAHRAGVVDVILPIQQVEFGIPISLAAQPDLLDIPAFYQRGNGNFWVALAGKEVAGTIALLDIGTPRSPPAPTPPRRGTRSQESGAREHCARGVIGRYSRHEVSSSHYDLARRSLRRANFFVGQMGA
jgi:hypothetical protein